MNKQSKEREKEKMRIKIKDWRSSERTKSEHFPLTQIELSRAAAEHTFLLYATKQQKKNCPHKYKIYIRIHISYAVVE